MIAVLGKPGKMMLTERTYANIKAYVSVLMHTGTQHVCRCRHVVLSLACHPVRSHGTDAGAPPMVLPPRWSPVVFPSQENNIAQSK